MTKVEQDYDAGLFVPAYYGNRFTVATKEQRHEHVIPAYRLAGRDWPAQTISTQQDADNFVCDTLGEAQVECDRRNQATICVTYAEKTGPAEKGEEPADPDALTWAQAVKQRREPRKEDAKQPTLHKSVGC